MKIYAKIVGKIDILWLVFTGPADYSLTYFRMRNINDPEPSSVTFETVDEIKTIKKRRSCFVFVSGYGVITRTTEGDALERTVPNSGEFISSIEDEKISFVRLDRLQPILDRISKVHGKIVAAQIIPSDIPEIDICGYFIKRIRRFLSPRNLLRKNEFRSPLAGIYYDKLKLIIPLICLFLLLIGLRIEKGLESRCSELERNLYSRMNSIDKARADEATKLRLMERLQGSGKFYFSWICDRLAMCLPLEITLTELVIQPPIGGNLRTGEQEYQNETVYISGVTVDPSAVTYYVSSLGNLRYFRSIVIADMDTDRREGNIKFKLKLLI